MPEPSLNDVFDLLERVLVAAPAERKRILAAATDDAVRERVVQLLSIADATDERSAAGSSAAAPAPAEGFLTNFRRRLGERMPQRGAMLRPGDAFDGLTVRDVLGVGGMGEVYLAQQSKPRRDVAVKLLSIPHLSERRLKRFELEHDIVAGLDHPGVVTVHAVGVLRETKPPRPYIVMEYVRGALPIVAYAQLRRLTLESRLRLFALVCDAVAHAHRHGVLHRDLKPANILVDENARPRIIDFGVARLEEHAANAPAMTMTGELVGTAAYMAPEQLRGDDVDTRADVYALGIVLFELVTDALPYEQGRPSFYDVVRVVESQALKRPREIDPKTPRALEAVVLRATAPEPEKRYQSASELERDVRAFLSGERVAAASRSSRLSALRRFVRKRPKAAMAAAWTLVLVSAAALAVALVTQGAGRVPVSFVLSDDQRTITSSNAFGAEVRRFEALRMDERIYDTQRITHPRFKHGWGVAIAKQSLGTRFVLLWDPATGATTRIGPRSFDDLPTPMNVLRGESEGFRPNASVIGVADVFDVLEGDEIVIAVNDSRFFPAGTTVYAATGELLFCTWHPGWPEHFRWDPKRRRLLVTASANRVAAADLDRTPGSLARLPHAVFAVTPRRGVVSDRWLGTPGAAAPVVADFYSVISLPNVYPETLTVHISSKSLDAEFVVGVPFRETAPHAAMAISFDDAGEMVDVTPTSALTKTGLPDPRDVGVTLVPLRDVDFNDRVSPDDDPRHTRAWYIDR